MGTEGRETIMPVLMSVGVGVDLCIVPPLPPTPLHFRVLDCVFVQSLSCGQSDFGPGETRIFYMS